jgi:hypothetical protein
VEWLHPEAAVLTTTPVAGAGGWVRHAHGDRAFYRRRGDDASLMLAALVEG